MTKTICIYHGNCADGFTAAWAVKVALGPQVEFVPGVYGQTPPDVSGADVVLVDFSYKRPVLEELATTARTVLVLDHHKSAAKDLAGLPCPIDRNSWDNHLAEASGEAASNIGPGLPRAIFDMKRSGAQIAWDFFHPGQMRPALVDYVADRDLWLFELEGSREIAAWLHSHPYDFGTWASCANMLDDERLWRQAVQEGTAIKRKHDKDIAQLLTELRRDMVIGGHRVPVVNLPFTMASDAAGQLAEGAPFAAVYFDRADARIFSLRSREGGMDVSKIAEQYGGGGHPGAAGFQAPIGWEGDL
ncbi:DHHA1 domain-containing protein [Pseudophaeobacter sp. C1-32P7]|uniref:DHHA1 domain-containing protein n=1 Tax=Pseudophaeobacter sp. C1-32P7 TaxID=3098142 RepID=UPI0034D519E9